MGIEGQTAKDIGAALPMDRMGKPADIARVAVFLASEESAWVTGERITASGGQRSPVVGVFDFFPTWPGVTQKRPASFCVPATSTTSRQAERFPRQANPMMSTPPFSACALLHCQSWSASGRCCRKRVLRGGTRCPRDERIPRSPHWAQWRFSMRAKLELDSIRSRYYQ